MVPEHDTYRVLKVLPAGDDQLSRLIVLIHDPAHLYREIHIIRIGDLIVEHVIHRVGHITALCRDGNTSILVNHKVAVCGILYLPRAVQHHTGISACRRSIIRSFRQSGYLTSQYHLSGQYKGESGPAAFDQPMIFWFLPVFSLILTFSPF